MSDITDLHQNDYKWWEDPRVVTVSREVAEQPPKLEQISWTDSNSVVRGGAIILDTRRTLAAFGGSIKLQGDEVTWVIPDALLSDGLQVGDIIYESASATIGTTTAAWRVQTLTRTSFGNQWVAVTVKHRRRT